MRLEELTGYLDEYLRVGEIPDYPAALNGLQVAGGDEVERVAFAVDAAQATIDVAVAEGAHLLIVHHGLFWDGNQPMTGRRFRRLKALIDAGLAVYSSHLPLDVHPEVGNNVVLAKEIGIEVDGTFGDFKGIPLGIRGRLEVRRERLAARLDEVLGCRVKMIPGGPEVIRTVGVITGGAGSEVLAAGRHGLDAYVTGEAAHHNYFDAMEGGVNLYLGGHYATETWGLRALADHLSERFGLDCSFISHPTGL
jgi:dinuclear metal center YbgI/SA1388 family protein